jgi:flagellar biosynthesis protein FlhG
MPQTVGEAIADAGGSMRVIAVSSGKGGVGKTNLVTNLAVEMAQLGRRVLLIDADLGLANVDIVMGLSPQATLAEVIRGERRIDEAIVVGPAGVRVLPSASGVAEIVHLSPTERLSLLAQFDALEEHFDVVLIDTGAGISENVLFFASAAQEVIVVAVPEPTSIADAYALMKVLGARHATRRFRLVVNQARSAEEGRSVYARLSEVTARFLDVSIDYLGHVLLDPTVRKAVSQRKPLVLAYPECAASRAILTLSRRVLMSRYADDVTGRQQLFWRKLVSQDAEAPVARVA